MENQPGSRRTAAIFVAAFGLILTGCTNEDIQVVASCFDHIKNQDELGIDCGGSCKDACPPVMSAVVNGAAWTADSELITSGYTSGSSTLNITGSPASGIYPRIQLVYLGPLSTGSHALDASSSYVPDLTAFIVFDSGTITLTSVDGRNKVISGTFSLTCTDTAAGVVYSVTNGVFDLVPY